MSGAGSDGTCDTSGIIPETVASSKLKTLFNGITESIFDSPRRISIITRVGSELQLPGAKRLGTYERTNQVVFSLLWIPFYSIFVLKVTTIAVQITGYPFDIHCPLAVQVRYLDRCYCCCLLAFDIK